MLSKRYKTTEVDWRTLLHVPSGTPSGSTWNTKGDFFSDVYTILKRIKWTIWTICAFRLLYPRQLSWAKKNVIQKIEKWCPKSVESSLRQIGWCNKPITLQFQSRLTRKILRLSNATNQPKSTVELGYMCPPWSTSSYTHQVVEIWKESST